MSAFIFCLYCQSNQVDVRGWEPGFDLAIIRCTSCDHEAKIEGFTLGRPYPSDFDPVAAALPRLVELAALDMATPPGKAGVG